MASKLSGIELTRYNDLFKTATEREANRQARIQIVPAIDRPTPDLVRLMDSIEHIGIAEPLIVRPREIGGYEIISDHRLNMSCIGATNYSQKTFYISEASATLYEFGHFLDWTPGIPAEHEQLYLAEAQYSGLRDYAKTNARNTSRTALTTGSHTAAMKNAWKPFGMPRRRPGPILRHWRKQLGRLTTSAISGAVVNCAVPSVSAPHSRQSISLT